MDIVYIRDLRIDTIIGIYDWEREVRQTVSLDLEMAADIRRAATTDDIAHALNYKAVAKRIIAFIEDSQFLLVERMAEEVASLVLAEFEVPWLRLRVSKPGALRGARDVGILIERGTREGAAREGAAREEGAVEPEVRDSRVVATRSMERDFKSGSDC